MHLLATHLISGLIDKPSFNGEIICEECDKKRLSECPNELLIFGAEPLRCEWLNGSLTLNKFEFVGLKLFNVLPGMFTGAVVPCNSPERSVKNEKIKNLSN